MTTSSFRWMAAFLFAAVLMLSAHPAGAQSDAELDALYTRLRDLYRAGMYDEAKPAAEQYVAATKSRFGEAHQRTAIAIGWMADVYGAQGRYAEAEPLYKLSLAIKEKVLGPQDLSVAITLNNLAILYKLQGRNPEAEAHYKRSLATWEKAVGPDHDSVGNVLANLATLYSDQRRFAEAETLYKRALAIREKALGKEHASVGSVVNNLAHSYREQGRLAEAEPLYKRALAIAQKAYGADHPTLGRRLNNLGAIYQSQGRFSEAEPFYKRALAISERSLGPNHPDVALQLWNLALLAAERGEGRAALAYQRRATAIRIKRGETGRDKAEAGGRELVQGTNYFRVHVFVADRAGGDRSALLQETFEMAQWALQTRAADALAQMSARFAAGTGGLAGAVRERQDLISQWQHGDGRLNAATSAADAAKAEAARNEITALEAKLALLDRRLATEFPDYFQLATPKPLDIAGVQAALKEDEVLVTFLDVPAYYKLPETMFAWVVTKTTASWRKLPVTPSWIAESVAVLRCGLDQSAWNQETGSGKCNTALKVTPREEIIKIADKDARVRVLPFDVARAHELYKALLGPVEDLISGKHLIVVPSGPLTSLPFNVLVAERPKTAIPGNLAEYRDAAWLEHGNRSRHFPPSPRSRRCASSPRPAAPKNPTLGSAIRCSMVRKTILDMELTTRSRRRPRATGRPARRR